MPSHIRYVPEKLITTIALRSTEHILENISLLGVNANGNGMPQARFFETVPARPLQYTFSL
jgi:hypothetical protein